MSYVVDLKIKPRRHPIERVTPAQAIARLNTIVDEANAQIAKAVAFQRHFEQVATELALENSELRRANAALAGKVSDLEKQLRKRGKAKGTNGKIMDDE